MKAFSIALALTLLVILPLKTYAQIECAGSLTQEHFFKEIKDLNVKIQANILEGRKIELELPKQESGSPKIKEMEKRLAEIKAEIAEQKKTFLMLNSDHFPSTPLTALGAACNDRRWVEQGKDILIQNPEKLGQHYFIWIDKTTRQVKAGQSRPNLELVAK